MQPQRLERLSSRAHARPLDMIAPTLRAKILRVPMTKSKCFGMHVFVRPTA